MKRFVKYGLLVVCVLVAIPTLFIAGVFFYEKSIIFKKPGALVVPEIPGLYGASVNCFSGTGGYFFMSPYNTPAATTPFGMVRLGPDTQSILIAKRGLNPSGYYYGDNQIIGFSHNRLVGADSDEGGAFRIFPTVESRAEKLHDTKNRYARFSHKDENAFPGYYAVLLPKDNILAEMTATPRVGVHRYTFRKGEAPHLLVDVTSFLGDKRCEDGYAQLSPDTRSMEGKVTTFGSFSGRYGGLTVYFVAEFSEPITHYGAWIDRNFTPGAASAAGNNIGMDLAFANKGQESTVEVRLALSYVSTANARKNLEAEAQGKSFSVLCAAARDAWEKKLSRIRVEGGDKTQQRIFYTALYHAFQMPTIFTDVNGEYIGFDRAVHKAEGFQYYTDFSLWDTFRTVHPLYNLIARSEERDMMVSLVEMAKAGGCLPRWPSGCGYTNCMFGTPADVAVSEAYLKGIRDFDIQTAYQCMRQTGLTGKPESSKFGARHGLSDYLNYGYLPYDKEKKSVAATIEYSFCDNAIALLAEELGYKEDAQIFASHAKNYKNLWNPVTRYLQPKDSQGNFYKDFKPLLLTYLDFDEKYTSAYVEGSAEQWRWAIPHDPEGLLSLFPNKETFLADLETFFKKARKGVGAGHPGSYYWHGNEPYIYSAYLFNAAGRPDLAQKWVRWILDTKYSDDHIGLDGNDDGGTLSSWYVFNAMGIYPVAGTKRYEIGSPIFSKAEFMIGDKLLTMVAENNSAENTQVKQVFLNDKPLDRTWFSHDEIAQGGVLRFVMGK